MRHNLSAIAGGLLGGGLAAVVAGYAAPRMLSPDELTYSLSSVLSTFGVAALGGAVGVLVGWLVHRRRGPGLGGITAIVAVLGALGGTWAWAREASSAEETGLFLVATILMAGGGLIGLTAVCGFVAALLQQLSRQEEPQR